ncbi:hypothetical protein EPO33_04470 [Patescibacteria group bacterium]|nr:MAG: hypothetical protein EPO33_04470 [Patescibacteria group bacterium]
MSKTSSIGRSWGSILNSAMNRVALVLLLSFMLVFALLFTAALAIGSAWELTGGNLLRRFRPARAQ